MGFKRKTSKPVCPQGKGVKLHTSLRPTPAMLFPGSVWLVRLKRGTVTKAAATRFGGLTIPSLPKNGKNAKQTSPLPPKMVLPRVCPETQEGSTSDWLPIHSSSRLLSCSIIAVPCEIAFPLSARSPSVQYQPSRMALLHLQAKKGFSSKSKPTPHLQMQQAGTCPNPRAHAWKQWKSYPVAITPQMGS